MGSSTKRLDQVCITLGLRHRSLGAPDGGQSLLCCRIAHGQQTRLPELRAAMSLCRLWCSQNKATEVRQLLAGTYAWFTEGFDTPDLQEAKALLEQLAEHAGNSADGP